MLAKLLKDGISVLVTTVLLRSVIAPILGSYIRKRLIKTERDFIIWMHYKNRTRRRGHKAKFIEYCNDGHCMKVTI